jgi:type IV secretory pathway VirB10-like protein
MKLLTLLLAVLVLTVSGLGQAEVYKWKDKDGTTKYSDTPPPSNIKQEAIRGKKKATVPTGNAPLSPVQPAPVIPVGGVPIDVEPPRSPEDIAAEERQQKAEAEKNNKKEKEADAKRKAENCSAAKANMQTYTQGGRVYEMNEKGERVYMDESGFKAGREKAQQEINENC